jgi:hypothetical protein
MHAAPRGGPSISGWLRDTVARRRVAAVIVAVLSIPLVWWAGTPQSRLAASDETRAAAPLWPQHWAYYTTDPASERTVVITGRGLDGRWGFGRFGRGRWWTLNLQRAEWLRFAAVQQLADEVPEAGWTECTSNECATPDASSPPRVRDSSTWSPCGNVTLGRLTTGPDGAPTTDQLLRLAAIAVVDVRCVKD